MKKTTAKPKPKEVFESIGLDAICARIEVGESQREIARALDVDHSRLVRWLAKDENKERAAAAREASAEAWLDRGLEAVERALRKDSGYDANAARAFAQECARRAALRNPRYVEKTAHEHSGNLRIGLVDMSDEQLAAVAAGGSV